MGSEICVFDWHIFRRRKVVEMLFDGDGAWWWEGVVPNLEADFGWEVREMVEGLG